MCERVESAAKMVCVAERIPPVIKDGVVCFLGLWFSTYLDTNVRQMILNRLKIICTKYIECEYDF